MSIEQEGVVDFASGAPEQDQIILFISDHLPWSETEPEHLNLLQGKINRYLAYVESGEILEQFPFANEKKIVIDVLGKYELNDVAKKFYISASDIVEKAGFELKFEYKGDHK